MEGPGLVIIQGRQAGRGLDEGPGLGEGRGLVVGACDSSLAGPMCLKAAMDAVRTASTPLSKSGLSVTMCGSSLPGATRKRICRESTRPSA